MEKRQASRDRLERLLHYRQHGVEPFGVMSDARIMGMPAGVPDEVRILAKKSRVNLMRYVVASRVQDMYVDGYKTETSPENVPAWDIWQANQLDARQVGIHRAALTFGAAYAVVLPGKPYPVIRGVSPARLTVLYGDDDLLARGRALEAPRRALASHRRHVRLDAQGLRQRPAQRDRRGAPRRRRHRRFDAGLPRRALPRDG
jgi:hypothetical protein